ncbi:MAG: hypothetical protein V3T05_00115 [Myxococcota bacterium]
MTTLTILRAQREHFEARLACVLVERGLVDKLDLEEAFQQQITMGGHLSTNLWELGFVGGAQLTRVSAEILGLPVVNPRAFGNPPQSVLERLPIDFIERKRILPLEVAGRTLRVVTSEPWDHLALGEAARHYGFLVEPFFLPEVPLFRLLSRFYGLPLGARFRLRHPRKAASPPEAVDVPWDDLRELPADIATIIKPSQKPDASRLVQPGATPAAAVEEKKPLAPLVDFNAAVKTLEEADGRDAVGLALARFALSRGKRAALFIHRSGQWSGWLGAGEGVDNAALGRFMVQAEKGTIFGLVSETGAHFLGVMPKHDVHTEFLNVMGVARPGAVALFPVHFRGKLIMGLYMDAGHGADVPTDVADILLLAQKVPTVLERLVASRLGGGRG